MPSLCRWGRRRPDVDSLNAAATVLLPFKLPPFNPAWTEMENVSTSPGLKGHQMEVQRKEEMSLLKLLLWSFGRKKNSKLNKKIYNPIILQLFGVIMIKITTTQKCLFAIDMALLFPLALEPTYTGWIFLTVPPNFSTKMKNDGQPIRDSVPWCTKDPRWLNNVFLFSTEIWAEQLKKHLV